MGAKCLGVFVPPDPDSDSGKTQVTSHGPDQQQLSLVPSRPTPFKDRPTDLFCLFEGRPETLTVDNVLATTIVFRSGQ